MLQPHHPFMLETPSGHVPPTRWHNHGVEEQSGAVVPAQSATRAGITNSKSYFVDSRTRIVSRSPSAADFEVVFDRVLHNVTSVRLISAIIPIINTAVGAHGAIANYQPNTYVMLHLKPSGGGIGQGSTLDSAFGDPSTVSPVTAPGDAQTRNIISDADSLVAIPLNPNGPNIDATGGGVIVNFTHWEDKAEHDAVLRFKSPLSSLKGLEFKLMVWANSNGSEGGRTQAVTYPLPDETTPPTTSGASGLLPINQVQYQIEIVSSD